MIHLIAIQNRNDARYLTCCINSILGQPDIAVVGIDAGSDDNSLAVYEQYRDWLGVVECPGLSQAAACNLVIRRYWQDEWETFTWINADDWFAPDWVDRHQEAFEPDDDILCTDALICYEDQPERGVGRWSLGSHDILERLALNLNYVCQPTVMIRRRVFQQVGLFDESIRFPFDYEFWRRCAQWKLRFHHLPHTTAWRRQTGAGHGKKKQVDGRLGFTDSHTAEIRAEMDAIHARYKDGAQLTINPL